MSMALTLKDVTSMRLPLATLIAALAITAVLINFTSAQHKAAETQRLAQTKTMKEARERYQRSGEEREAIDRYLPAYRKLQDEGLVGAEQRIEWIEGLRSANKQAGLFGVSYQLEARKPFLMVGQNNPASQFLQQSMMKLSFGLVHEGDLMRFLQLLATQQSGMFFIRSCTIDRPARVDAPAPRQPNLNAQCELSWLTIDPGKAAP
ncbi:MAG TPA: hypothetical protein VF460_15190 [Burkholderiales bacterium]